MSDTNTSAAVGPSVVARRRVRHGSGYRVAVYLALLGLVVVFIAPLAWVALTSFKTDFDATRMPPTLLPNPFTVQGYETLFTSGQSPVLRWFLNSLVAATAQMVLVLATASAAAYALARMDFPGKRLIFALVVATLFVPPVIFLIPNFLIVDSFGWLDTLWAVIVPGAASAFGVFFLRQFFLGLPREIEEAAFVDGASHLQVFLRIVLPLSRPALATLAVLSFLTNWNDLIWPLYVLLSPENLTLQPGLSVLQGTYTTHYGVVMAGGIVASVPVLLLFLLAQRHVVESVANAGLKG